MIITEWIGNIRMPINWQKTNVILMGLLFCSCEDNITDNSELPDGIDPADWVELYNSTNDSISIGLWEFKDGNDDHVFIIPEDQVMVPGEYLVLCRDTLAFKENFPSVVNFAGELGFGLSGGGELIRLLNSNGDTVDVVEYDNASPWPTEPDGNGPTLELIYPSLNNDSGTNWAASDINGGTPGMINSVYAADNSNSIVSGIVINEINYNAADEY